jgi:hypothetical protein
VLLVLLLACRAHAFEAVAFLMGVERFAQKCVKGLGLAGERAASVFSNKSVYSLK